MTTAQISLMKELLDTDRRYRSMVAAGLPAHRNDRGVEVGRLFGADPRTVRALEAAGLIEVIDPGINGNPYAFLGQYEPYDVVNHDTGNDPNADTQPRPCP